MTDDEAFELIAPIGGSNNTNYWRLHLEVARHVGRYGIAFEGTLFAHCVEHALTQYQQMYNDPRLIKPHIRMIGADEYDEIMAVQELIDGTQS